ncbi:MAG: hypothetical protein ACSLEM_00705 [Candidatus Malihini olakiniferum]
MLLVYSTEISLCTPYKNIPVDSIILDSFSETNKSMLISESVTVVKAVDTEVFSVTSNQSDMLSVKATGVWSNTAWRALLASW